MLFLTLFFSQVVLAQTTGLTIRNGRVWVDNGETSIPMDYANRGSNTVTMTGNETFNWKPGEPIVLRRASNGALRNLTMGASQIKAGMTFTICNTEAGSSTREEITVLADDATVIRRVYESTCGTIMATIDRPTNRANWVGMNQIVSEWQPTDGIGWNENSFLPAPNSQLLWKRIGDTIKINQRVLCNLCSTTGASAMTFTISSGIPGGNLSGAGSLIRSANMEFANNRNQCGTGYVALGSPNFEIVQVRCQSTSTLILTKWTGTTVTTVNFDDIASNDDFSMHAEFPIEGWGDFTDSQ